MLALGSYLALFSLLFAPIPIPGPAPLLGVVAQQHGKPATKQRIQVPSATAQQGTPAVGGGNPGTYPGMDQPATQPVWVAPQMPHSQNPTNPLAWRVWGVYHGPQDQLFAPYERADTSTRAALDTIRTRPRTKWYGAFVPDAQIGQRVDEYLANSQNGNAETLSQMAVFRMSPWEHEACRRAPSAAEQASYRTWIANMANAIGDAPTLIVMQPDGPFLWCAPNRAATASLLTEATKTLSSLPNTSVYIDAGAADWCENERAAVASRCAELLTMTGIEYARGFALDSTHYTGPADNIRHGTAMVEQLAAWGYGEKHFIIDTAKSGSPMSWNDVIPAAGSSLKDNARTCTTPGMTQCVTTGIPPTARPADPQWGLADDVRALAARHVDGFVWFGRPWLNNQADPFVMQRALDIARSTPWPASGPYG